MGRSLFDFYELSFDRGLNGFARTNAAYNSFRKATISERKQDPQSAILNEPPPTLNPKAALEESVIKPRPAPNPTLFERQVRVIKEKGRIPLEAT